ncbi:unnamed protein product [Adineta steineri]|uniref:Uncharacterized protein n=1 Tax=Adineta steineri TaxID=433720 RepID=A0A815J5J2_9BILA|nr:unnamed protein product [Adineta steineri]CAF4045220.1 unnamed protein product [Adineta steineri]
MFIALTLVGVLVAWTFGGINSMLNDPTLSIECLGFVFQYGVIVYVLMFISIMVYFVCFFRMAKKAGYFRRCCNNKIHENLQFQPDLPISNPTQSNIEQNDIANSVPNVQN